MGGAVMHGNHLNDWFAAASERLAADRENVISIDLDQIVGLTYLPPWDVATALDLYLKAISVLPQSTPWLFSLAISLQPTDTLDPETPDLDALQQAVHDTQPPAFYLIHPRIFVAPWEFEEFRAPVSVDAKLQKVGISARYVCFRTPQARDRSWEWSRAMWLDRWPGAPTAIDLPTDTSPK
jgi:hypothetical protein